MKERPILFSAPMVRAILEGRKTQTRRIVNPLLYINIGGEDEGENIYQSNPRFGDEAARWAKCPYGAPGDRLWVRETWQAIHVSVDPETGHGDDVYAATKIPKDSQDGYWRTAYAATDPEADHDKDDRGFSWRPGIHMPRWASRITLDITGVRVERLHDITEADARAEGVEPLAVTTHRLSFGCLWRTINGAESWDANPWVWVVEFRRVEAQERAA